MFALESMWALPFARRKAGVADGASLASLQDAIPLGPEGELPSLWFQPPDEPSRRGGWRARIGTLSCPTEAAGSCCFPPRELDNRFTSTAYKGRSRAISLEISAVGQAPPPAEPTLSPDLKRVAYLAMKAGNRVVVVADHVESPSYDAVHSLEFPQSAIGSFTLPSAGQSNFWLTTARKIRRAITLPPFGSPPMAAG